MARRAQRGRSAARRRGSGGSVRLRAGCVRWRERSASGARWSAMLRMSSGGRERRVGILVLGGRVRCLEVIE